MRAIIFHEFGSPAVLKLAELPKPQPGPDEVLVRVKATFVAPNRDVGVRSGTHPILRRAVQLPHVLGGEHAGVVEQVGAGVDEELVGLRVAVASRVECQSCEQCLAGAPWDCSRARSIGLQMMGSDAEFTAVPVVNLQPLPSCLSFAQAAVLAANGPLAHEQLELSGTEPGDVVLVPGANGSVGLLLVALAARRGARVISLTRGRRDVKILTKLGADVVLDATERNLSETLLSYTSRGVDAVLDNVASPELWNRYWPALGRRAHVVFAGAAGSGGLPLALDVVELYRRQVVLTGLTMGDRRQVASFWNGMRSEPLGLPPELIRTFPLEDARSAHTLIEQGGHLAQCVLVMDGVADGHKNVSVAATTP
jgi:NADPH:quinone reductase-like Zn-dependent oxidoreductase